MSAKPRIPIVGQSFVPVLSPYLHLHLADTARRVPPSAQFYAFDASSVAFKSHLINDFKNQVWIGNRGLLFRPMLMPCRLENLRNYLQKLRFSGSISAKKAQRQEVRIVTRVA